MNSLRRTQSPDRPAGIDGTRSANVPAGGTSAVNRWQREIRHFPVLSAALGQAEQLPVRL